MKRREFIINSALLMGGTALLSGCNKKEVVKSENQVVKRKYKDIEVPLIALGCMRLPMRDSKIDMVELDKMVEYSMRHGANYFDTAYMYVDGKSENAIGEVLKKYKRDSFFLADKSPIYKMKTRDDVRKIFEEQLKKCQVEYFDFYMCHNINQNTVDTYRNVNMVEELKKLKDEGKIKYLGFSFHGTPEILKDVVKDYKWDFAQLQVNYLDWDVVKAHEQYDIVQKEGIPVTVMEPLRGGGLVNLSDKALAKLKENSNDTPAAFGLRWAASRDNVVTVLSGMSNLEQVRENIQTFIDYYKVTDNKMLFKIYYESLAEDEKADKCIKCGLCNKNCPQSLDIPNLLAKIDEEYKKVKGLERK